MNDAAAPAARLQHPATKFMHARLALMSTNFSHPGLLKILASSTVIHGGPNCCMAIGDGGYDWIESRRQSVNTVSRRTAVKANHHHTTNKPQPYIPDRVHAPVPRTCISARRPFFPKKDWPLTLNATPPRESASPLR